MPAQSAAARSEEIQKRLQLVRERRERERRAFDELAAQAPELSADAIRVLARQRAEAETPREMQIEGGVTIRVGDSVKTADDALQLSRSERGLLLPDPVKRVYLGEKGRVLRVMRNFHSKPAVELRFADGAEKVFFVECLELAPSTRHGPSTTLSVGREPALSVASTSASSSSTAGLAVKPATAVAPPTPMPLLGWSELASLARRTQRADQMPEVQPAHNSLERVTATRGDSLSHLGVAGGRLADKTPPAVTPISSTTLPTSSNTRDDAQARTTATRQSSQHETKGLFSSHLSSSPSQFMNDGKHQSQNLIAREAVKVSRPMGRPTAEQSMSMHDQASSSVAARGTERGGQALTAQGDDDHATITIPVRATAAVRDDAPANNRQNAVNTPLAPPPVTLAPSPFQCLGLVKEVVADHVVGAADPGELGRPYEAPELDIALRPYSAETDNLLTTPRPDLLLTTMPAHLSAQDVSRVTAESSDVANSVHQSDTRLMRAIPVHCSPDYNGRFAFTDVTTQVPRYTRPRAPHTRRCWVAGLSTEASHELVEYVAVTLLAGEQTTLQGVLRSISDALGWHAPQLQATRLFMVDGDEVVRTETITEAMRLVATTGFRYTPAPSPHDLPGCPPKALTRACVSTVQTCAPQMVTVGGTAKYGMCVAGARTFAASGAATPNRVSPTGDTPAAAVAPATTPGAPRTVRKQPCLVTTTTKTTVVAPLPKPIHVRVFENGVYDDNSDGPVYRTITVRPTYKSLKALHSIIERELGWRDGRRVDTLYDASGVEITSLTALFDGEAIVASAGDRFVVPYPNTVLHQEAMKLSHLYK